MGCLLPVQFQDVFSIGSRDDVAKLFRCLQHLFKLFFVYQSRYLRHDNQVNVIESEESDGPFIGKHIGDGEVMAGGPAKVADSIKHP